MQSNGGVATVGAARHNPIALVESGPVSGILGAIALSRLIDEPNLIALDIGGTTAKCALIEGGRAKVTTDYKIGWSRTNPGYPVKTPVIEIVEIGNGGGSIAWLDAGGKLHVGPESAGAVPGPAAYGRGGTAPTTTDANLIAGRIDPLNFVGGEIVPDMEAVRRAFAGIAERIGVGIDAAARGVIRIANANMVNALKLVSVNKGLDPRDFALIAFGGGGGMHATALARELNIPRVIIPTNAAVFSAWGMLMTDLRRDVIRTRVTRLDRAAPEAIGAVYDEIAAEATAAFEADGIEVGRLIFQRQGDMRYLGQEHSVKVDFPSGPVDAASLARAVAGFHEAHEREYGFRLEVPVELVNYHLIGYGTVNKPEPARLERSGRRLGEAVRGRRAVDFDEAGVCEATIFERCLLEPGAEIEGPAIVEEPATTIVIFPGQRASVDEFGNVHIRLR
jgi:N-methylhydantoinase A